MIMKKFQIIPGIILFVTLAGCGDKDNHNTKPQPAKPKVSENGTVITFTDTTNLSFIKTGKASDLALQSSAIFPARVAATSVASQEGADRSIILFEDPELTANFTALIQHLININQIQNVSLKQRKIELDRAKDLAANGAATGREVLEAETALAMENSNLNNEKASLIEHEAKLKLAGFDPRALLTAPAGKVWIICEIPESMLRSLKTGSTCLIRFSSYSDEQFSGSIEAIGDVVNSSTRMVKLRLILKNANARLKAGMFATVSFDQTMQSSLSIPKESLITVQGKTYVFITKGEMQFERREVVISSLVNDRAIIASGIEKKDEVVTQGAIQLKGLSFGY